MFTYCFFYDNDAHTRFTKIKAIDTHVHRNERNHLVCMEKTLKYLWSSYRIISAINQ